MSTSIERRRIAMPTRAEDQAITAAARTDADAPPLKASQLKAMVPARSLQGRAHPKSSQQEG